MAIPKYYTEAEGAKWREWSGGNVDGRGLKKRDPVAVTINGITVHALAFDTGEEWDCVNGWRPEPTPEPPRPTEPPQTEPPALPSQTSDELQDKAQAYALRVWAGQSVSLGVGERRRRVFAALEGQGLPTAVRLPCDAEPDDDDEDDEPVVWRTQQR